MYNFFVLKLFMWWAPPPLQLFLVFPREAAKKVIFHYEGGRGLGGVQGLQKKTLFGDFRLPLSSRGGGSPK